MIRLKQKKAEEEKKAVAEAEKQQTEEKGASLSETSGISDSNTTSNTVAAPAGESGVNSSSGGGGLKLLGIGGKSTRTNGEGTGKTTGKKKTPGEIRIQKGMYIYIFIYISHVNWDICTIHT